MLVKEANKEYGRNNYSSINIFQPRRKSKCVKTDEKNVTDQFAYGCPLCFLFCIYRRK
jgi:hypothetical protein